MSKTERNKLYRINTDRKHGHTSGTHKGGNSAHSHNARHADKSGMRRHLIEQQIKRETER